MIFYTASLTYLPAANAARAYLCRADSCQGISGGGAYSGLSKDQTAALPPKTGASGKIGDKNYPAGTNYQYDTKLKCANNFPEREEQTCDQAMHGCQTITPPVPGYMMWVWRRVDAGGDVNGPWENLGFTCWPELVPGSSKPQLTLAMIEHEWSLTPFAKPQLSIQPVHNRTLVTLPTYFKLNWPELGYQPGEERTLTLLGRTIKIRPTLKTNVYSPTLKTNVYNYGDGTTSGPTTSLGGAWPQGDVRHSYKDPGKFQTAVATTYGGQYALDGGPWTDLPGTTTITGPTEPLQVLTTTNHLY